MIYDLFAIRYATNQRRTRRQNFIPHFADPHDGPMPMDFFVWVAVGGGRKILIDSGADQQTCIARGHEFLQCPTAGLASIGIDGAEIDTVLTTHLHWDHAGNYHKFCNARFHAQRKEIEHAVGPCMCAGFLRRPYDVEQVVSLVRMVYADRATLHDGDEEIAPGLSVHRAGGHTPGLQVVRVNTRRGVVVLASDALHFFENAAEGVPFPVVVNIEDYLNAHKRVAKLAESPDHIIPGHDPLVMSLYPPASPSTAGAVARLDVDQVRSDA